MPRLTLAVAALVIAACIGAASMGQEKTSPTAKPTTAPTTLPVSMPSYQLTEAQEKELLDFLKQMHSDRLAQLDQLRQTNMAMYNNMARSLYYWMKSIKQAPKHVWQAMITTSESYSRMIRLASQVNAATDPNQKAQLKKDLDDQAASYQDALVVVQEYRIEQLKAQLEALQKKLDNDKTPAGRKEASETLVRKLLEITSQPAFVSPTPAPTSQPADAAK